MGYEATTVPIGAALFGLIVSNMPCLTSPLRILIRTVSFVSASLGGIISTYSCSMSKFCSPPKICFVLGTRSGCSIFMVLVKLIGKVGIWIHDILGRAVNRHGRFADAIGQRAIAGHGCRVGGASCSF
ncbi:hypothetical protein BpHYR1_011062 [Brachionus plicatilis]|uniref:Uncharacterized protein n=1 Tax=Brachionus plicatilis TaxID=10195 RepID=A0A3M7PMZ8_BRAPC|nr:hypothetical protein BpHYR1_011062 [Brachionus plicatilis]